MKSEAITLQDKVEVISTGKDTNRKAGEVFKCHPKTAEKLVRLGRAKMAK